MRLPVRAPSKLTAYVKLPTNSAAISQTSQSRSLLRNARASSGFALLGILCLGAILAPASPYPSDQIDLALRYQAPSFLHPLGTDDLGRDVLTRVLAGGRISLSIGLLSTALAVLLGTLIGATAGYREGIVDTGLMRATDFFLAFPSLFVLLLLAALVGPSYWAVVLAIAGLRWMWIARVVRAGVLQVKRMEFVTAAQAVGASGIRIVVRHVLANVAGSILTSATLTLAGALIAESSLSFLGLGIQPPTPSWGNMLRAGQPDLSRAPLLAFAPGACIFLAVYAANRLAESLRQEFDPSRRHS